MSSNRSYSDEDSNGYYDYDHYQQYSRPFQQTYRCHSLSDDGKSNLENGDKILMPASALARLANLLIEYPMSFELSNPAANRVSHCGVQEFTAEEGVVHLPCWMMKNMLLKDGDIVHLKSAKLRKGTYVKLQPHSKDFLDISNPKAMLEKGLRSFTCLTTGDTIEMSYNNKNYCIDILEAKPSNAVSVIDTDCEVDFAPPLDYIEPEKPKTSISSGKGKTASHDCCSVEEAAANDEPKFIPFKGVARRLGGGPSTQPAQTALCTTLNSSHKSGANKGSTASSHQQSGKLVFGSSEGNAATKGREVNPKSTTPEPQNEDKKFQAFSGKSYSMRS